MASARRWTHRELMGLTDGAGRYSLDQLRQRAGPPHDWPNAPTRRSRRAIYGQFRRLHGEGGLTRGAYTLDRLIETTGYSRSHFLRAQRALRQQWRRLTPRGPWLILEDQAEEIIAWLRVDHWSKAKRLDGCVWCSTTAVPMHALGLCRRDYLRYRRVCRGLGIPLSLKAQAELVAATGGSVELVKRLGRGLALARESLVEIAARAR